MKNKDLLKVFIIEKKQLLISLSVFLGVLIISLSLYFYYKDSGNNVWKFLPENVIAVLQIPETYPLLNDDDSISIWPGEDLLPFSTKLKIDAGRELFHIVDKHQPFRKTITLHGVSESEAALMFLIEFHQDSLEKILLNQDIQSDWKVRRYKGFPIFTKIFPAGIFNCYAFDGYLVGSFSSLLLEESIRTLIKGKATLPDKKLIREMNADNPSVQLVLKTPNLQKWMNSMLQEQVTIFYPSLSYIPDYLQFNLKSSQSGWKGRGKYYFETNKTSVVKTKFDKNVTKSNYVFTENLMYYKSLQLGKANNYASVFLKDEKIAARISLLKKRLSFDYEGFTDQISGKVDQYIFERPGLYQPYKFFKIPIKDSVAVAGYLQKLHPDEKANLKGFTRISLPELPRLFIPESMNKFPATFYKISNNKLWLANLEISDQEFNQIDFSKDSGSEFYSYYINGSRFLAFLQNDIKETYRKPLSHVLSKFNKLLLNLENDSAYLEVDLIKKNLASLISDTLVTTKLPERVKPEIDVVLNHNNWQKEFILQDEKTRLILLSDSGEMLWRKAVWRHTISNFSQVDIYFNKKLQYAFISDGQVHVYDRLGRRVNGFPLNLPTYFESKFLLPLRWKNDKEQRFLVAGEIPGNAIKKEGRLYLLNRYGGISRAWNPRKLEAPLASKPIYLEDNGKTYILILLENGSLYALDKNARVHPGFPLLTNLTCHQPLAITKSGQNPIMHILSDGGEIIALDLKGNLHQRKKLHKSVSSSLFFLVKNQVADYQSVMGAQPIFQSGIQLGFVLVRQDEVDLTFFDDDQKFIFKYTFPDNSEKHIQYYKFGPGKTFISVYSSKSKKCWLFDGTGNLIFQKPFQSDVPITISYLPNERIFRMLVIENKEAKVFQVQN